MNEALYDVKLKISVDVQQTKLGYTFTLHHAKKATTWQEKAIGNGFKKVMEIVDKHNREINE